MTIDMSTGKRILLSFTIPCYRSESTISSVVNEVCEVASSRPGYDYEIICVNDCSPDGTWAVLCELAQATPKLSAINLASNRGKHMALLAAFRQAKGDYVIAIDDDGETPVSRLWELIEPLEQGYDVSIAKYPKRPVSWIKNFESDFNAFVASKLYGKPRGLKFTNFIARKKFVCDFLVEYRGNYPMLEGGTLAATHNIATVEMEPRSRISGSSGFTFRRGFQLWLNGCTTYSLKPLRFAWYLSAVFLLLAVVWFVASLGFGWPWWGVLVTLGFSLVFGNLGLIGEYVGRGYLNASGIPQYAVSATVNCDDELSKPEGSASAQE